MKPKQEALILAGVCTVVLLACLGGIVWDFATALIASTDGLLLLFICLSLGAVFTFVLFLQARTAGWLEHLPLPGRKKTEEAKPAGQSR